MKGLLAVSPRFPAQRSSEQGESAPKARQRCVADGKQVNIPVPLFNAMGGRIAEGYPVIGFGFLTLRRHLGKSGCVIQGVETSELVHEVIGSGSKKSL